MERATDRLGQRECVNTSLNAGDGRVSHWDGATPPRKSLFIEGLIIKKFDVDGPVFMSVSK